MGTNHPGTFVVRVVDRRRRPKGRSTRVTLVAISTLAVLAGCGSSSNSGGSTVSKASFCAANAKLDKATASATNVGELVKDLKTNQATVTEFGQAAPSAIKAKAQVLVAAAQQAIKSGSTTGFNQQFANAGTAVDKYCGQKSSG